MTMSPGENVGPYRIIEQLGSGGMATVFKSYHAALDRHVAIKVLHAMFKGNPQFFERFQREARIVAKLEHPNIIPVYDFNEHNGEPYLVMRYVEGDTLKPKMNGQTMPAEEVLRLIRPVCDALTYAHQKGVLHRDIKPSNIMVTEDGLVFVTDFGLARMMEAGESTLSQDMMMGTPQYISPEQAQGVKELDGRTDVYSTGVVLYEMLTGRVPFNADTPFATVHDHIYSPLPPPSSLNPQIDSQVENMLLKALAKEPNDRYDSIKDLYDAAEASLGQQIAKTPTLVQEEEQVVVPTVAEAPTIASPVQKKKGIPWWVWAGGASLIICLLAALLVGLLLLRQSRRVPPNQPPAQAAEGNLSAIPPEVDPDSPEFRKAARLMKIGQEFLQTENPEAALDAFIEAGHLVPEIPMPFAGQALALMMMDEDEAAKKAIDRAFDLDPHNAEARLANAFYIFRQGDRRGATQELQSLARDPHTPLLVKERANELLDRMGE